MSPEQPLGLRKQRRRLAGRCHRRRPCVRPAVRPAHRVVKIRPVSTVAQRLVGRGGVAARQLGPAPDRHSKVASTPQWSERGTLSEPATSEYFCPPAILHRPAAHPPGQRVRVGPVPTVSPLHVACAANTPCPRVCRPAQVHSTHMRFCTRRAQSSTHGTQHAAHSDDGAAPEQSRAVVGRGGG